MIKSFILTSLITILLSGNYLMAQTTENDSIPKVKPSPILPATSEVKADTIPLPVQPAQNTTDTTSKRNEPKIYRYDPDQERKPRIIERSSTDQGTVYYKHKVRGRHKDSYRKIHTLTGRNNYSGGFGAISFKSTELRDETIVMAGVRAGWIINRALGIGFEGFGIIPTATFTDIGTQNLTPNGGYGGMFLEPVFFSNQVVHVTFPVSAGAGWLGYYEDDNANVFSVNGNEVAEDVFWYVEPGASIEVNIARNFRLAGGVSKRFVEDLEMLETSDGDFETLSYFVTLKIGSF
ncbi:MAG: hypothetical protein WBA74_09795 [Cyclobacteriaceae bacterium]